MRLYLLLSLSHRFLRALTQMLRQVIQKALKPSRYISKESVFCVFDSENLLKVYLQLYIELHLFHEQSYPLQPGGEKVMRKNPAHLEDIRQEVIRILYLLRRLIFKLTDFDEGLCTIFYWFILESRLYHV